MKMNFERKIHKILGLKKILKKKGNKLNVKYKGYYNYFKSWRDKSDIL